MDETSILAPLSPLSTGGISYPRTESAQTNGQASGRSEVEGVKVNISAAAREYARQQGLKTEKAQTGLGDLTPEEEQKVREMAQRDREVRTHEQAHISAGGGLIRGGPNYAFRSGPDGKRYVVSGEVNIDTSPVRDDPEATIQKANRIRAAALAPADPSPQDRQVAASADKMAMEARQDKQTNEKS